MIFIILVNLLFVNAFASQENMAINYGFFPPEIERTIFSFYCKNVLRDLPVDRIRPEIKGLIRETKTSKKLFSLVHDVRLFKENEPLREFLSEENVVKRPCFSKFTEEIMHQLLQLYPDSSVAKLLQEFRTIGVFRWLYTHRDKYQDAVGQYIITTLNNSPVLSRRQRKDILLSIPACNQNYQTDKLQGTILQDFVGCDYSSIAKSFIRHGANINARDALGYDPLLIAFSGKNVSMIKLLIKHGADINQVDLQGDTILHMAVQQDDFKMVLLLLKLGADSKKRNNFGICPRDLAKTPGLDQRIRLLFEDDLLKSSATSI